MLPNLANSQQVQESIQDYRKKSEYLTNDNAKEIVNKLINKLEEEVKIIDQAHRIRSAGELKPNLFMSNREKVHNLRKQIITIYKENNIIRY
tara:strand:+ start:18915 stop:19190 length:276 start_codon:yes stop_codon:yes gene_type:complete